MTEGFFKLKRSFFTHWLWDEDVVFHKRESFLDLLQLAAFAPTKRVVKGKLIKVPIGGIVASERFLSERWKWSRTKVRHFLSLLEADDMIEQRKDQGQTVLILRNYGKHARLENHEKAKKEPPEDHPKTSGVPNKKKVKKGKKGKKGNTPHGVPEGVGELPESKNSKVATNRNSEIPSLAEAIAYARSAPAPISTDCAEAWLDSRTASGWTRPQGGNSVPIADWRADLRGFSRSWSANRSGKQESPKPPPKPVDGPEGWEDGFREVIPHGAIPIQWDHVDAELQGLIISNLKGGAA